MMPENRPPSLSNSTAVYPGFHKWSSPIPYLVGALALMLGLVALAVILLACSFRKSSSEPSSNENNGEDKSSKSPVMQLEMEPRFLVVMAGDHNPTYLAMPSASSTTTTTAAPLRRTEEV